ncbi:helix-turn-helix domain-containing protein [Amycolatopsis sp. CA-230715]|uniref:helix-turn-helix domain-containing protein n=1 Tax=Amycolatopsis sp. CA-230715 TaxID=2745196 RepID=UPI001C02A248|nr:helix-turn-helix transcriptional regulator [Amycolatopsis sp. CA-230715]QWF82776.1 hypothetical protein HUW46_06215 [Amycolatopsis sp. CA-230715]
MPQTLRLRKLGKELNALRTAAKISDQRAADELGCSAAKIRHIESGRNAARKAELKVLLDLYGAEPEVYEPLEELRREGAQRGWWATYGLPVWLQAYVGMENEATEIRVFELESVTALLQTREYARAIHEQLETEAVNKMVDARIRRQSILTKAAPVKLRVTMSESAIRRAAVIPDGGAEQLRHLITMSRKPNVDLRILPFSAGLHPSMSGSFHLLRFDPEVSPPAAYQEYAVGGHLVDEDSVVATLDGVFETATASALGARDSVRLIERIAREAETGRGNERSKVAKE